MMNLKYYLRGLGIGIVVTAVIMSLAGGKEESLSNAEIKERARELGMVEEGTTLAENLSSKEETSVPTKEPVEEKTSEEMSRPKADEAPEEIKEPEGTMEPKETEEPEAIKEPKETEEPDATKEPKETQKPEVTKEPKETQKSEATTEPRETKEPEATTEPEEAKTPAGTSASEESKTPAENEAITLEVKSGASSYSVCRQLEEAGLIASAGNFDSFLCQNGYDKRIKAGSFEIPKDADPEQIARIISGME